MEKNKLDLNKLSEDELDEIIAGLEEQDKKAAEDEIPMAEGMAREAFSQFVPGGQWLEAKGRSFVGPETMDEELAMVRGRQKQFQEESPRAALLGGTAGALGQVGAATALLGPVGAAASLGGRFGIGATEQALQAGVGEGLSAKETAKRALIGGAAEALIPMLPGSVQKGMAAGALGAGILSPEDSLAGAGAGAMIGAGVIPGKALAGMAIRSKPVKRLISKMADVENDANSLANWVSSISMGGTLKNIKQLTGTEDIKTLKAKQQEYGSFALGSGLISPEKRKQDILRELVGDYAKDADLQMVGVIDGLDFIPGAKKASKNTVGGKIHELTKKVDETIDEFEKSYTKETGKDGRIDLNKFVSMMKDDINEKIGPTGISKKEAEAFNNEIDSFFAVEEKLTRDGIKYFSPRKEKVSLKEFNQIKRNLGQKLTSKNFFMDTEQANKKEAMTYIYGKIKKAMNDSIDDKQDFIGEKDYIETINSANTAASQAIDLATFLTKDVIKEETQGALVKGLKMSFAPAIAGGLGYAIGGPLGTLATSAGMYGVQQYSKNTLPQQVALALNGSKVPKTVKDIITYKDLIATKIVLSGNMPLASQFLSAANNNNEADIEKMMPLISNEHPDIFPSTEYKSEYIDSQGQRKVTDSVDKEIIRNQIRADENMSNHEKAMKAQKLNKSGVIDGPKQAPNQLMLESMKYFKRPGGSEYLKMLQDKMKKPSDLNPAAKKQSSGIDDFMNRLQETHLEKLQRLAREKKGQ